VAALALADAILEFWTIAIVGLVAALLIVIARRLGQGRDQAVGQTFNTVLLLVVLISLVLTATLKLGSPLLLKYVVVSRNVGSAVDAFLQIAAYGIIFQSISFTYTALYVGLGRTRVLVGAGTVLVLTNFVLSYVLIFGKLGLPPMGIEGAALGELGAEVATLSSFLPTPSADSIWEGTVCSGSNRGTESSFGLCFVPPRRCHYKSC